MKTSSSFQPRFLATFALVMLFSGLVCAQSLQPQSNWLQTWKSFAGNQQSATWLADQIANDGILFTDKANGTLVLKTTTDWSSLAEMEQALEEGIQAGNGNHMFAAGTSEAINPAVVVNTWQGLLGGQQVYATVVGELDGLHGSGMIIRLSRSPLPTEAPSRKESALALLHQLSDPSAAGPMVLK